MVYARGFLKGIERLGYEKIKFVVTINAHLGEEVSPK